MRSQAGACIQRGASDRGLASAGDSSRSSAMARVLIAIVMLVASGCAGTAKYVPPETNAPAAYKELGPWKATEPRDETLRGKWWEVFGDARLNEFEERATVSNQTLQAAYAQFLQARALVRASRAAELPGVNAAGSVTATSQSTTKPNASKLPNYTDYLGRLDLAYEVDVWGRVANTVAASRATAQASAADLEVVNLSIHADVAVNYFQVRALDTERQILESSVAAFQRALDLTRNRYQGGVASGVDVAQAETQLETTRTQAIDVQIRRAQLEHAIAALVGQPAATFTMPAAPLAVVPPIVPVGLPSALLERRPDVAGAERRLAAAHAQIGVARAAFFPTLSLTGTAGLESASLGNWLKAASSIWTAVPAAAIAVFDNGRRRAASEQAQAAYQRAEAQYRDAVLTALRDVEDNLATLRILNEEARTQEGAVAASTRLLTLATNRYKGGVTTYLEVVSAQNAALANQRTALNILARQLTASVTLIKALGGGWDQSKLPRL